MTKELKDAWLAALRSGKYKQTQGHLWLKTSLDSVNMDKVVAAGNCCLGVLCRISAIPYTWKGAEAYFQYESGSLLDEELLRGLGLSHAQQTKLARMNDDGKSFEEIADWIERNV